MTSLLPFLSALASQLVFWTVVHVRRQRRAAKREQMFINTYVGCIVFATINWNEHSVYMDAVDDVSDLWISNNAYAINSRGWSEDRDTVLRNWMVIAV